MYPLYSIKYKLSENVFNSAVNSSVQIHTGKNNFPYSPLGKSVRRYLQ